MGPSAPAVGPECVFQAFESCMLHHTVLHTCRHKLDFSTLKLLFHERVIAVVVLGPFLTAPRRFLELEAFAHEPDLRDFAMGPDRINDLKVLPSEKLADIHNFTRCLFDAFLLSCVHMPAIDPLEK
jgi:hypothetical protein